MVKTKNNKIKRGGSGIKGGMGLLGKLPTGSASQLLGKLPSGSTSQLLGKLPSDSASQLLGKIPSLPPMTSAGLAGKLPMGSSQLLKKLPMGTAGAATMIASAGTGVAAAAGTTGSSSIMSTIISVISFIFTAIIYILLFLALFFIIVGFWILVATLQSGLDGTRSMCSFIPKIFPIKKRQLKCHRIPKTVYELFINIITLLIAS